MASALDGFTGPHVLAQSTVGRWRSFWIDRPGYSGDFCKLYCRFSEHDVDGDAVRDGRNGEGLDGVGCLKTWTIELCHPRSKCLACFAGRNFRVGHNPTATVQMGDLACWPQRRLGGCRLLTEEVAMMTIVAV